MARLGLTKVSR